MYKAWQLYGMAQNTDIHVVASMLVKDGLLIRKSSNDKYLCPYHIENTGSFGIYEKHNSMKCFGCGKGVKPVSLYSYLKRNKKSDNNDEIYNDIRSYNLSEKREIEFYTWASAAEICYRSNQIDESNYNYVLREIRKYLKNGSDIELSNPNKGSGNNNNVRKIHTCDYDDTRAKLNTFDDVYNDVKENYDTSGIASNKNLNLVYTAYLEAVEEVRGYRLFKRHLNHLLNERHLTKKEIKQLCLFSRPTKNEEAEVVRLILKKIRQAGLKDSVLKKVPGFIWDKNNEEYKINLYSGHDPFFILSRDLKNNIQRFQQKNDTLNSNKDIPKYNWHSTPDANNCKSPTIVTFPENKSFEEWVKSLKESNTKKVKIRITEGFFKALEITRNTNDPCISIQGVSSWKYAIIKIIQMSLLLNDEDIIIDECYIVFDADIKVKNLVPNSENISRVLENEGIKTYYTTWDEKYGKGYDDCVFNNNADKMVDVKASEFEKKHYLIMELICEKYEVAISELTKNDIKSTYLALDKFTYKDLKSKYEQYKKVKDKA